MNGKKLCGRAAALAAAAMITVAGVFAVADSKYNIRTTKYELEFSELPAEFDGFRIVHLSDLHGSCFGENNSRLAELVKEQKPDIIALTGDFASNLSQLEATQKLLEELSGSAPIYYVSGNHEWAGGIVPRVRRLLSGYGVSFIDNESCPISRGESRIVIAGSEDPNGHADSLKPAEFVEKLREEYPEEFVLLLGHRNYWVKKYPQLPVQLILSGHAHGGIVRLPLIGGLLSTDHNFIAEYEKGLYRGDDYIMEVSTGLGNSIFVPRLFNPPEIVCITLRSSLS